MRNASLYTFLKDSLVFERIINLVKAFPWNNFLQLKVINLFEEVLNSCQNAEFKAAVLEGSGIGKAIVEMAENPTYETEGGKPVRHGYMAVVIDIANKMVKRTEQPGAASTADAAQVQEDMTVINYLDNVTEWKNFTENELSRSNKKNNKTLGGSSRPTDEDNQDDDGEINYDVQMDKIMARFNSFNQIIQNPTPGADDDDDGDDDELTQDEQNSQLSRDNWDEDDDEGKSGDPTNDSALSNTPNGGVTIQAADPQAPAELDSEFVDNSFWKVGAEAKTEDDVDALLAELED